MPVYKLIEFVPCKCLGVDLFTVDGHQFVEAVVKGSVAEEDAKLEPGDIMDELLGHPLRRSGLRLRGLMKENEGWPVAVRVIKARLPDQSVFPPLLHLLKMARR